MIKLHDVKTRMTRTLHLDTLTPEQVESESVDFVRRCYQLSADLRTEMAIARAALDRERAAEEREERERKHGKKSPDAPDSLNDDTRE